MTGPRTDPLAAAGRAPGVSWRQQLKPQLARFWRGRDVALGYAAVVLVISLVIAAQPQSELERIVDSSSTNLVNLRSRPLYVLVVSAFVVSPAWGLVILVPLVEAYGALQRWLGRASTVIIGGIGHIGATLFVATLEASAITRNRAGFRIARDADVGVSYGLAAVLGVLVARVSPRWRRWYVVASVAVMAGQLVVVQGYTALGHITAWALGLALARPISRAAGQPPTAAGPVP